MASAAPSARFGPNIVAKVSSILENSVPTHRGCGADSGSDPPRAKTIVFCCFARGPSICGLGVSRSHRKHGSKLGDLNSRPPVRHLREPRTLLFFLSAPHAN